ncbi:WYL domain-containing protein [endosymbiont of Ridgeia piscesae]|uniref:Rho-binding antiterminator n=1 Tax=endosymbiont of Ridgeia piscesae TaxID=54398 RepID=A0A0T5Z8R4_9GAMM|nr:transcriptional antiterminator, Rof [endosymbiont of Ridgeia piscesae]KRT54060.1 Transcriptional antiterminator Rof (Rho-off) [endosymbiont of Ridgeia piscesae]KRT58933.1 Rho-binding antiterminator [endosymbiont of Ridgeia piscesae]
MKAYKPIPCMLHEQYEFAALKMRYIELVWLDEGGTERSIKVKPIDLFAKQGAEYLKGKTPAGEICLLRLDQIKSPVWAESGEPLLGSRD